MIETTSKRACERIQDWVMENSFDFHGEPYETFEDAATGIWHAFVGERMRTERARRAELAEHGSWEAVFEDWLRGLPYAVDSEVYYWCKPAAEVVGDILEATEEERGRMEPRDAQMLMSALIWREVTAHVETGLPDGTGPAAVWTDVRWYEYMAEERRWEDPKEAMCYRAKAQGMRSAMEMLGLEGTEPWRAA